MKGPNRAARRRAGAGPSRRGGFRGGGSSSEVTYTGIQLTSTAQFINGGAGAFNAAILWKRSWFSLDAKRASGTCNIVGTNAFGLAGVGVIGETQGSVTTPDRCRVVGFHDNKYSSASALNYHVPCDTEFGRVQVHDVWLDTSTGRIYHAIDGCPIGIGSAATASTTMGTTAELAINGLPGAPSTNGYGAMTWVGTQFSTAKPSDATIEAAWSASPETEVASCVRFFVAKDRVGSTIACRKSGAVTLTVVGSPATVSKVAPRRPVGVVEQYGDSIAVCRRNVASPYDSDTGWKQTTIEQCCASGRFRGAVGANVSADLSSLGVGTPKTCDRRHTAAAGQSLGVGIGPRLSTLATDLPANGHPLTVTAFAYGINDLVERINNLGQTAPVAVAGLQADHATACSLTRAARPTSRIEIHNILRAGTGGSGINATVQAAIGLYNAGFDAMIANLNTTYGNVRGIDVCSKVTATQADADNTGVLYDFIHETDATKVVHGNTVAAAELAM